MSDRKSGKVHCVTSPSAGYTFCGRYVTMTLQVSRKAGEVTCAMCLREISNPDRPADGSTVLSEDQAAAQSPEDTDDADRIIEKMKLFTGPDNLLGEGEL